MDILLVEDDPADIYVIQRAIADCSSDIRVWLISRGSDALAFLRQEPPFTNVPVPSLILLDLTLPGRDGHDILADIRTVPAHQRTPVVIVSGRKKSTEEPRCLQLGANAYVEKSTDFLGYFYSVKDLIRSCFSASCLSS